MKDIFTFANKHKIYLVFRDFFFTFVKFWHWRRESDQQELLKLLQQLLLVHNEPHHTYLIYYGLLFITNVFIIIMVIS